LIVLARHPPTSMPPGLCYGRFDAMVADLAATAALIEKLAAHGGTVWTSPASRCRVVADALGDPMIDPRLQELDFGDWEGLAWDDVPRAALDEWAADPIGFAPPGGESGAALVARVSAFAADLSDGNHRVITHGGPLKVLGALLRGWPVDLLAPAPACGSVTIIESTGR
jgi:alpha-ribazole phosphatase